MGVGSHHFRCLYGVFGKVEVVHLTPPESDFADVTIMSDGKVISQVVYKTNFRSDNYFRCMFELKTD